jgi:hypothetical protein
MSDVGADVFAIVLMFVASIACAYATGRMHGYEAGERDGRNARKINDVWNRK